MVHPVSRPRHCTCNLSQREPLTLALRFRQALSEADVHLQLHPPREPYLNLTKHQPEVSPTPLRPSIFARSWTKRRESHRSVDTLEAAVAPNIERIRRVTFRAGTHSQLEETSSPNGQPRKRLAETCLAL
ncbi:hypothetical protein TgHK011_008824 [Trichoderma gracile]|nr:hypothetical protein TgHK011_008824 [Trichoderma gracile]